MSSQLTVDLVPVKSAEEAAWCAHLMSSSEPWITLQRSYDQCLTSVIRPDRESYIIRADGKPVGFVILCMVGAFVGYLQAIYLDPAWRGNGIGSKAIGLCEERILRDGQNVFMCVSSFNERARRLYQRLGYEEVGSLRDFIVAGHDEILLRKTRGPHVASATPTKRVTP